MVKQDLPNTLKRLLAERLTEYKVPNDVRDALVNDIIGAMEAPSRNKSGATVMTAEASRDADRERKHGASANHAKPKVM